MIDLTRSKLIQELNQLKIELDRGNKIKDEITELRFVVTQDRLEILKLMATNGNVSKVLVEKKGNYKWRIASSNHYVHLATWFCEILDYESNLLKIQSTIKYKIKSIYRH